MSNETHSKVKIISEWFIKPNNEVEQSKYPHFLSTNDLFHLSTSYMHRGLLYTKSSSSVDNVKGLVDKLKHSMSLALVDFYPLAGRLTTVKCEDDHACSVHVDPDIGPGARFIHADASATQEHKVTVSDIVSSYQSISRYLIWSLFDAGDPKVVCYDGHTRALVSVQVTDLVDGVFIGFTMNHSVGDGTSLWLFINALSRIFMDRENNSIEKPIFKTLFEYGYGSVLKIPYLDPSEFISRLDVDPRLTFWVFHFSAASIARLKVQATEYHNSISSFQALSAFVWLSIARARNLPLESDMGCWVTADTRPRCDPPFPSNQFGNFIHFARVTSKMKELMESGLGWASMLLHQAIMGLDDKVVRGDLKARTELPQVAQLGKIRSAYGNNPPVIFTGSMRFDAYKPEFGLGKVVATRAGYSTWMDGRIIVDPGREGGGSADLQVCLLSETMAALESDDEFMSYIS